MLTRTFLHAPGIGVATERSLWDAGAHDWERYVDLHASGTFAGRRYDALAKTVTTSQSALASRNVTYFSRSLPSGDHWRLFDTFSDRAAFVDIETTGLVPGRDKITVVALHDGNRCRTFVRGKNLNAFPAAISRHSLLVTFNGICFDVPFLRREFRGIRIPPAHVDLRYAFARLGYRGGLKVIEPQFGVKRPKHLKDVDGIEAVRLWRRHERGERGALDTLLEYVEADVTPLAPLARAACDGLARAVGMPRVSRRGH